MKKFLIILLVLIMITHTACNNRAEIEKMDMDDKLRYADYLDFTLEMFIDGQWVYTTNYSETRSLIRPDSESPAGFYTEVRFLRHPDEATNIPNTVILAFPHENSVTRVLNAINWEVDSAGIDLSEFSLSYPITVENLVDDYEWVYRLIRYDEFFIAYLQRFVQLSLGGDSRIGFELVRLREQGDENVEKVLVILDQLNMTQDEAGPLLRAAGSLEAFITVTDLMLAQGLSAEDALAQVARE